MSAPDAGTHPALGLVTQADAQAARLLVDAWAEGRYQGREDAPFSTLTGASLLELRGLVTQLCADVRLAGYLEGVQRGRQEAAHVVLDALRGEGLAR